MSAWLDSARAAAEDLLPGLASHVWISTLFLLAMLGVLAALRRRLTAGARFSLALVGLAKFALPHALVTAGLDALDEAFRLDPRSALGAPFAAVAGVLRVEMPEARLWPAAALGLWAAVALFLILRLALAHRRLAALLARDIRPARPREAAALERARRHTGARGPIRLARSPLPEAPAAVGIRRPWIVLPLQGCDDLSEDELESLLRHECAHVVRHDNLVAGCASVLSALFWFHPLVWIAQNILRIERERACDEIAVSSGEGEDTYLTALDKLCHAAIGTELPGMCRMATAQIKERIDHIMRYPSLKSQSPSPLRAALLAAAVLALFTLASGLAGSRSLAFADDPAPDAYTVQLTAERNGDAVKLTGTVTENATQTVIAVPSLILAAGQGGTVRSSAPDGKEVVFEAHPGDDGQIAVEVTVESSGAVIQKTGLAISPSGAAGEASPQFTGEPINLDLKNADLREILSQFESITGMQVRIDDGVQGTVTLHRQRVPWDEAFDSIVKEHGLTYRIEGSTIVVSKQ